MIRSPLHSLPHTGTSAATVLRQYVHRRPRARRGVSVPAGWNGSAFPVEFQDSMSATGLDMDKACKEKEDGDGDRFEVCSETTSG